MVRLHSTFPAAIIYPHFSFRLAKGYQEARLLYSEWARTPSSGEYREAAAVFSGYLREGGIEFWIQDTSRLGEVPAEDLMVVLRELVPVAASSSLNKLARITSDERNMARFLELASQAKAHLNTDIEIQQFGTYREAAEWIWSYIR